MKYIVFLLLQFSLLAEVVTIAADTWCPYNCTPETKTPGFMVEIVKESFKKYSPDTEVKYIVIPWARAMKEARRGKISGIIGAIKSESKGLHVPKIEQGIMSANFFSLKELDWKYKDILQLRKSKKVVGAIKGYDYDDHIAKFFKTSPGQVHYSHGEEALPELIRLLTAQKINLLIEDNAVFWYKLKELKIDPTKYKIVGHPVPNKELYVSFHNIKHAQIVSKGMTYLRKTGKLTKILKKYNLKDWK